MPACFQLFRKDGSSPDPIPFPVVDEEICAHLGVTPDPVKYYMGWYDAIGFLLAIGKTWSEILLVYPEAEPVLLFMEATYTPNAWYSRSK